MKRTPAFACLPLLAACVSASPDAPSNAKKTETTAQDTAATINSAFAPLLNEVDIAERDGLPYLVFAAALEDDGEDPEDTLAKLETFIGATQSPGMRDNDPNSWTALDDFDNPDAFFDAAQRDAKRLELGDNVTKALENSRNEAMAALTEKGVAYPFAAELNTFARANYRGLAYYVHLGDEEGGTVIFCLRVLED